MARTSQKLRISLHCSSSSSCHQLVLIYSDNLSCGRYVWENSVLEKMPPKTNMKSERTFGGVLTCTTSIFSEDSTVLFLASCLRKNGTSFPHWAKNPEKLKVDTTWQDQGVLIGIVHCSPPQEAAMLSILGLCRFQGGAQSSNFQLCATPWNRT